MIPLVTIAICIGVLVTLVTVIAACVCGCKNSNQKSELIGTAGVVKIHYDEDAPSPTPTTPASIKRASTQNSHRSLPEIPHPMGRHDSGDTTSEIYATVNLNQAGAEIPTPSSREHPYEHAYAKLQNENHVSIDIPVEQRNENDMLIEDGEVPQSSNSEPVVISASVAISGQVPSSQELPYITPPAINEPNVQHFSGDSTDSTKGYTSISVREPLSNILAQSKKIVSQPHYATVSDDSDEMYAAIDEASAGNGSDTYAQIVPQELREVVDTRRSLDRDTGRSNLSADVNVRRSAPPEIGAVVNAIATHSRQPSSSSGTNSQCALGSPKPEKRQANSPLPPTPSSLIQRQQRINSTGDLHINNDKIRRSINEKHQRNNSCVSSSDFYGCNYPVDKHRFSSSDLTRPLVARELNFDIDAQDGPSNTNLNQSTESRNHSDYATDPDASITTNADSPSRNLDDMYAKVIKKTKETPQKKFRGDDPGYETIDRKRDLHHGYETINKTKKNQDPGYETVKDLKKNNQDNSGPNSLLSSDPGYEHINKMDNSASDSDPNYEVLRTQPVTPPYTNVEPNYTQPTYSTVNKKHKYDWSNEDVPSEPNYESMPHDPLYTTGSESDPNYESVRPKDYESISTQDYESLRLKDPKYESVRSKRSKDGNYESVKYFDVVSKEPPYEKVGNSSVDRSDSMAGYESIQMPTNRPSVNNGDTVSDYFQV